MTDPRETPVPPTNLDAEVESFEPAVGEDLEDDGNDTPNGGV